MTLVDDWFAAAQRGNLARMQALLAEGVDIDATDERGNTALHYAMAPFGGVKPAVEWLLESGANMDITNTEGVDPIRFGYEGAMAALEASQVEFLETRFAHHRQLRAQQRRLGE